VNEDCVPVSLREIVTVPVPRDTTASDGVCAVVWTVNVSPASYVVSSVIATRMVPVVDPAGMVSVSLAVPV
jgi:hypothetical protein